MISPGDVYDALGAVSAELQCIQFRLGLEREFPTPKQQYNKTPDDIINIIDWATALLPEFELGQHLQQYDRTALLKTPNQVFSITEHILEELKAYRNLKGIKGEIRKADKIHGLKPQHVYAKGLEILEKVNTLRQRQQYGAIAVPNYPLRLITPTEVFDLTLRLDEELAILYLTIHMKSDLWITSSSIKEYHDKTASDVFYKMQQLSNTLDTILGTGGYTSNDVYKTVLTIKEDIQLIADKLGEPLPKDTWIKTQKRHSTQPKDVLIFSQKVLSLIYDAQRRAGLFILTEIHFSYGEKVTPTDVFNQVRLVQTELIDLKIALGIKTTPTIQQTTIERTPADVLHLLEGSAKALQVILHTSGEQL